MNWRLACFALLAAAPHVASAQLAAQRIEVFETAAAVFGATPLRVRDNDQVGLHGGMRLDAGLQFDALAVSLGVRVWELLPTNTFGGAGLDGFGTAEWRVSFDTRTIVRASVGAGIDAIDGGRGTVPLSASSSGVLYSFGAARELFVPSGLRIILSADLVFPHADTNSDGRRRPVLELGVGGRARHTLSIAGTPGMH